MHVVYDTTSVTAIYIYIYMAVTDVVTACSSYRYIYIYSAHQLSLGRWQYVGTAKSYYTTYIGTTLNQ